MVQEAGGRRLSAGVTHPRRVVGLKSGRLIPLVARLGIILLINSARSPELKFQLILRRLLPFAS
jgi:hypothetical protein